MVTANGTEKRSYSYPKAKAELKKYKIPDGIRVDLWATDDYVNEPGRIGIRHVGQHMYMLYKTDEKGSIEYKQGYKQYRAANYYAVKLVAGMAERTVDDGKTDSGKQYHGICQQGNMVPHILV